MLSAGSLLWVSFLGRPCPGQLCNILKKGTFPSSYTAIANWATFLGVSPAGAEANSQKICVQHNSYVFIHFLCFILFGIFSISPTEVKVILFIQFLVMITQGYFSKIHTVMCVMGRHLGMTLKADVISLGDDDSRCLIARRPFGITVKV